MRRRLCSGLGYSEGEAATAATPPPPPPQLDTQSNHTGRFAQTLAWVDFIFCPASG